VTRPANHNPRLAFLSRVVGKQCRHLLTTDQRLFDQPFSAARAGQLEANPDLADRVEAFVGRFGRLQDTVGDKLLPALLAALGETPGPAIDNLDRAERLGWVDSVDTWMAMRRLRNQMIHEYVEDPALLSSALETAHRYVPRLIAIAERLANEAQGRGWV
jgi:hypothetical protein